jgi:hypothetical protein
MMGSLLAEYDFRTSDTRSFDVTCTWLLGGSEKPRHVVREAGLVITSDLRPVTPGSSPRLSTSLQWF